MTTNSHSYLHSTYVPQAAKSLSVQFAAKNEEMERGEWPLADFEKKEQ